jgi:hypothetical protein
VATILGIGPSRVRALPLAAGINKGGHYFGPSRVRALPLAAGISEGGHYFAYIIPLFSFWQAQLQLAISLEI